jgi:hypothetical protein
MLTLVGHSQRLRAALAAAGKFWLFWLFGIWHLVLAPGRGPRQAQGERSEKLIEAQFIPCSCGLPYA